MNERVLLGLWIVSALVLLALACGFVDAVIVDAPTATPSPAVTVPLATPSITPVPATSGLLGWRAC